MPPPLPFPFPMGIGNDICHIPRMKALLTGQYSVRFIKRILRPDEYQASPVAHIVDPTLKPNAHLPERSPEAADPQVVLERAVQFMAGRFAVKEAVIKAHTFADLSYYDSHGSKATFQRIKIMQRKNKSLVAVVWPPPGDEAEEGLKPPQEALVSISHEGDYATAMCLAFRHPEAGQEEQRRTRKVEGAGDGDGSLVRKVKGRSRVWEDTSAQVNGVSQDAEGERGPT